MEDGEPGDKLIGAGGKKFPDWLVKATFLGEVETAFF